MECDVAEKRRLWPLLQWGGAVLGAVGPASSPSRLLPLMASQQHRWRTVPWMLELSLLLVVAAGHIRLHRPCPCWCCRDKIPASPMPSGPTEAAAVAQRRCRDVTVVVAPLPVLLLLVVRGIPLLPLLFGHALRLVPAASAVVAFVDVAAMAPAVVTAARPVKEREERWSSLSLGCRASAALRTSHCQCHCHCYGCCCCCCYC